MRAHRRRTKDKLIHKHLLSLFIVFILLIIFIGAFVFKYNEGRSFLESIYFVIMTITTIGYGDYTPITTSGKIVAMIFAIIGVPIFIGIVGLVFEARFKKTMNKEIQTMQKEMIETEEKLEETEGKLVQEEKKLVKIKKEEIAETIQQKKSFFKRIFKK